MINVIHVVYMPLRIWSTSHRTGRSLDPMLQQITCTILIFFQFRIQILTHESNFHVTRFLYGSNIRDTVGRVSRSRIDFDVAATASRWILVIITSRWILTATASSRAFRLELQHSSSTFRPGILAAIVGTST
jgi:hypothetical protein